MAKTKQELVESICKAIDDSPCQYNPEHISKLSHVGTCFGDNFVNRIRTLKDRLEKDGIQQILDHCRNRATEYRSMQERHSSDIRNLKDLLTSNSAVNRLCLYIGDIHVIEEKPLVFGMTVLTPDGSTALAGITHDNIFRMLDDLLATYDHLPYIQHNSIRCPICGSTWQMFGNIPIVNCVRCNANWVLFTRRQFSCDNVLDPVSMDLDRGARVTADYLADTGYTVSNKNTLAKIKRAIGCIQGDKVVNIVSSSGKYDGWHISFKCTDGQIEHEPHFDECADSALRACNFSRDEYVGKKLDESMIIVIRVPCSKEANLDDLVETAGSRNQPKCSTYAIAVAIGRVFAMDADGLRKAYDDGSDVDDFKDLTKLCPWFGGINSMVDASLIDSDGATYRIINPNNKRQIFN